jgi:hypothetical protein
MSRFTVMIAALALAFGSGWLFANEVRPPLLEDVGMAMWIAVGGFGLIMSMMVSVGK